MAAGDVITVPVSAGLMQQLELHEWSEPMRVKIDWDPDRRSWEMTMHVVHVVALVDE